MPPFITIHFCYSYFQCYFFTHQDPKKEGLIGVKIAYKRLAIWKGSEFKFTILKKNDNQINDCRFLVNSLIFSHFSIKVGSNNTFFIGLKTTLKPTAA